MRYCPECNYQNPDGVDLCLKCSAALARVCTTCGQPVPAGHKFCGHCGARLAAITVAAENSPDPPAATLPPSNHRTIPDASGERREVTVLFLDMVDFTTVAHTLDSEEVYLLIDEAMRLLVEVVYKYEGTVDKFTGDGLMALFGAPAVHENDPERAVRTALEMQSILKPFRARIQQEHGFDFQVRIGLNTGPVIAGHLGSSLHMEYTVIGDTVNLAARLEMAAEPGTILASAETYQRTRSLFSYENIPPLTVKGVPEPILAFRPLGLREKRGSPRGLPGLRAPMVGRANDLARLRQALADAGQQQHRQVVLITGEAGVGKSRLAAEFRRALNVPGVRVYQGSCLAYARSTPLWVVSDLLRDMLGLADTDSPAIQQETLRAYLERLGLLNNDVWPYLANLLGLGPVSPGSTSRLYYFDAAILQQQTHVALRQLFLAEAGQGPTLLILEDLHWVDASSRSFLEYLIQATDNIPLMLILISRDAEGETTIGPLVAAAEQEPEWLLTLHLEALSGAARELLVEQLIPQNTPEARGLKKCIAERAEGNPFYVEEIIRNLVDQGGLVGEPGNWQVTGAAARLLQDVPGTVKELLLARFDRLPAKLRRILQKAAVLGVSFPGDLLQKLVGLPAEVMVEQLDELTTRQFLVTRLLRATREYAFRHALTQEVIYSTLLKRDRPILHAQAARVIERGSFWPADKQTEMLAYHYAESDTPVKAVPHLIAAAEHAARHCASETTIQHYRRALALLPHPPGDQEEYFRIRIGLGRALKFTGEFAEAGRVLAGTLKALWPWITTVNSDTAWLLLIDNLKELADLRQREGAYEEALTFLEAGLHALSDEGVQHQSHLWHSLLDRMAWVRFRQGNYDQAKTVARLALRSLIASGEDDPMILANLYNTLGGICWRQGKLAEAITAVEQSLPFYENLGYYRGMANVYGNLGILYDVLGNWAKAIDYHQKAYALRQNIGDFEGQSTSLNNLGVLHMIMGEHETAKQELQIGLLIRQRLGNTSGVANSTANLAHLALVQAQFDDAGLLAQAALAQAKATDNPELQIHPYWIMALLRAEKGNLQAGLKLAEAALQMAGELGLPDEEANCYRVLGILHARSGAYAEAETFLQQSIDLAGRLNNPYLQGQALLELGRTEQTRPDGAHRYDRALQSLRQAAHLFETLGAAYDLQVTRSLVNQLQANGPVQNPPLPRLFR